MWSVSLPNCLGVKVSTMCSVYPPCLSVYLCCPRFTSHHNRIHLSQGLDKEQWEGLKGKKEWILLFISASCCLSVSLSACRLWWSVAFAPQASAPASRCSNPVSSLTCSLIDHFAVRSCSWIVCMHYFMHVGLCLSACLSMASLPGCGLRHWVHTSVLVSGSS